MTNQSLYCCRLSSHTISLHQATIWWLHHHHHHKHQSTKPDLYHSLTADLDNRVTTSILCQLMGGLVTIVNKKRVGTQGVSKRASSIVADLQFALLPQNSHQTHLTLPHSNQRAPLHKNCIFQQIQPMGSLNALGSIDQSDWRVCVRRLHILCFAGIEK